MSNFALENICHFGAKEKKTKTSFVVQVKVVNLYAGIMGRIYHRKTGRRAWSEQQVSQVVRAVRMGMAKRQASQIYQVPRITLDRYVQKATITGSVTVKPMGGITLVFSSYQEDQLVKHLIYMSQSGFGFSSRDVRSLAYQMAVSSNIANPFDHTTKLAGTDWLRHFLQRHPGLALQKAEPTSLARIKGFSRESVKKFHELLMNTFSEHQYPPSRVWNMDETGFSTVSK